MPPGRGNSGWKRFIKRTLPLTFLSLVLLLVLGYSLGGFVLLPQLAESELKNYVSRVLERELRIHDIDFDPFNFSLEVEGVEPHYSIVVERTSTFSCRDMEIWVEVNEAIFSDEMQEMEKLERRIRAELDSVLGISTRVKLVEPKTLARSEGKAKRVIDRSEL